MTNNDKKPRFGIVVPYQTSTEAGGTHRADNFSVVTQ